MVTPTLYLIRGVPGSGKTTLARTLKNSGVVQAFFEADQYEINNPGKPVTVALAHAWCQNMARYCLYRDDSIAVSNTSVEEWEVENYRKLAEELGAKFVSIVVESRHDGKNIHGVPPEKLESMRKRFSVKV